MFNFYSDRRDAEMHIRRTTKPGNPRRFASWFQQLGRSLGSPSVNFSDEDYHKVTHTIRPRLSFEKRTPKLELWFCTGYCVYCWGQRARIEKPWIPWKFADLISTTYRQFPELKVRPRYYVQDRTKNIRYYEQYHLNIVLDPCSWTIITACSEVSFYSRIGAVTNLIIGCNIWRTKPDRHFESGYSQNSKE